MTQIGHGSTRHAVGLPDGTSVTLAWAAVTDTGMRREVNEDSFVARVPLFAVADGMGGHAAGDLASAAVVKRLSEHAGTTTIGMDEIDESLRDAVMDMELGHGRTDEGSGTTVTGIALATDDGRPAWLVFNIGDSRVYELKSSILEQLTVDHSIVQELVDAGHITRDEADTHPQSNVITRAVGFHEAPVPDYQTVPIEAGTRLLVCSDGLTKELTPYGIRHFLTVHPDPDEAARAMLDAALGNGGRDNVTMIVVDVLEVDYPVREAAPPSE